MLRYVRRRLLQTIPVFFGATLLVFAMVYFVPGDPIATLGGDYGFSDAAYAEISAKYNLDKPLWMQYLLYLKDVFTLDFDKTFSDQPVTVVMVQAFPITMKLALYALVIGAILGIFLGVIAGVRRGKILNSTVLVVPLLLVSVPTFVLGLALQFLLGVKLGIFPTTVGAHVTLKSLTIPALVLDGISLAYTIYLVRQSVSENVPVDYVRTARAKGLSNGRVMTRHILHDPLIPIATFLGGDPGVFMDGAITTEGILNISGVGGTLWQAIIKGEPATVVSVTTVLVLMYTTANLVVDLLYAVLDPRIRHE